MFISSERIIQVTLEMLERHQARADVPADVSFDLTVAATLLRHLRHTDLSDGQAKQVYARGVAKWLEQIKCSDLVAILRPSRVTEILDSMIDRAGRTVAAPLQGEPMKREFLQLLRCLDDNLVELSLAAPEIATSCLAQIVSQWLSLHSAPDLFGDQLQLVESNESPGDSLSESNLSAYFRNKLCDVTAGATGISILPGGFGKQTTLFSLASSSLNGDLVMRRDNSINPYGNLDCHIGIHEYPVLKAIFARGFPVPEPLYFEADSVEIRGPPFIIMRRVPGKVTGDATGGRDKIPKDLQRALAEVVARLHSVPALLELVDIPAFEPSLWRKSAGECTRHSIESHYDCYRRNAHLPVPVLHGLYSWLLTHLPSGDATPSLVHGDIGFHNLLFHEGQLTAVLDWEFSHVGDPAEDLGYIRSVMANQLDWPQFLADYASTGAKIPEEDRIGFFEIWSHVRNATCVALMSSQLENGDLRDIKLGMIAHRYLPHFLAQAALLIAQH